MHGNKPNTRPTNKLRLNFKAIQDPSLNKKVIVLDDSPPELAHKTSTRKLARKTNSIVENIQDRVSSYEKRNVQIELPEVAMVQRRVNRAMRAHEVVSDKLNLLAKKAQRFM
jgi:hypothetical protein